MSKTCPTTLTNRDERIIDRVVKKGLKKELDKAAKKKIAALARRIIELTRCKRTTLDLEDAVVVLEMMIKRRRCFMKELKAVSLNFEKYDNLKGF